MPPAHAYPLALAGWRVRLRGLPVISLVPRNGAGFCVAHILNLIKGRQVAK